MKEMEREEGNGESQSLNQLKVQKSKSATEATAKKVIVQQYKGAKKIVTETNLKKNK